jgi:hypothetical protein
VVKSSNIKFPKLHSVQNTIFSLKIKLNKLSFFADSKQFFVGFPLQKGKNACIWKFNRNNCICNGRYYFRKYSNESFCIDAANEYVWKMMPSDTEKIQRYLFNKSSYSKKDKPAAIKDELVSVRKKFKEYIASTGGNKDDDDDNNNNNNNNNNSNDRKIPFSPLIIAGGILASINDISNQICLPKRNRQNNTYGDNGSPLCIEISKDMLNSLIDLILYCISLKGKTRIKHLPVTFYLVSILNVHLKYAQDLGLLTTDNAFLTKKYQQNLKRILVEILGSDSKDLDPLIGLAADIFTVSLEIFVQTWSEKIGILTQIMDPTLAQNSKSNVFPMKPAAYNIISKHLLSRCYDLNLIKSLFLPVNVDHATISAGRLQDNFGSSSILLHQFLDSILQCISNDFDTNLTFLLNSTNDFQFPDVSDTSKETVEFLLLIHSYLMSVTEGNRYSNPSTPLSEESSDRVPDNLSTPSRNRNSFDTKVDDIDDDASTNVNPLFNILISHLSTFFDVVKNILQNYQNALGDKLPSKLWAMSKLVRILLSRLLFQALVFCTSLDTDCLAAQKLVQSCSSLSITLIEICNDVPSRIAYKLVQRSTLKETKQVSIPGFPYFLGPSDDDIPDQATWGTAYALIDYPATKSGMIDGLSAKFGSLPQGEGNLLVRVFTRVNESKFRLEREATVPIERKTIVLDEIVKLKVDGPGLQINAGEFPALYNPQGSLNIRTRKIGAPQRTIYYISGSRSRHAVGDEVKFTSYSNSDRRGSLLPGWYAHVNAPTALRNHYRPTGDKTKPKVPLAREESIGDEEDVLSEVGILFKLTQYQTWTTSRFASTLVKGSAATELEIKNEKWLSSLVFRGSMSINGNKMAIPKTPMAAKDPLTPPSLKRSVSSIEEESTFLSSFLDGGKMKNSKLLSVLKEEYKPNMYMQMLQRKGGEVVNRMLRKCYVAVLVHEQKFNKALGYEICATDGDTVPAELLDLWEFVQEKRQWFIREHEQLAGISYDKLCGQVDKRLDILLRFAPYDPTGEEGITRRSLKHQLAHTPTKRSWQAFQENFLEKSELGKMLQERSLLLNEKKATELPRDTAMSFALSRANAQDIGYCLKQRRLRAMQRIKGLKVLNSLVKVVFPVDELLDDFGGSSTTSTGRLLATIILRNFTQVSLQKTGGGADDSNSMVISWSACDMVAGCGANNIDQILEAHLALSQRIISVLLNTNTFDKNSKTSDNLFYFCIKALCVRYVFDNRYDISDQLFTALKQLLEQGAKSVDANDNGAIAKSNLSPTTLNLYEFLLFSSINESKIFSSVLKQNLFSLMAGHLEILMQQLRVRNQNEPGLENSNLKYKRYLATMPIQFGSKESVKGIIISRPPSTDFSYVISMKIYLHHLSKEQDTVLFKTGNVHKCTENDKTQSCAFIDKKTAHVQFKTKVRRSKEVQITEVQSDVEVEINQWVSLTFARKRLPKGSDQLYIFINGKIAGTTDITYGNNVAETKNGDISEGTKSNTDNIPIIDISNAVHQPASTDGKDGATVSTRLPLYVGVPSMAPHYATSATATEIAEKYLHDIDNFMFEGLATSIIVCSDMNMVKNIMMINDNTATKSMLSSSINKLHVDMEWILDLMYRCTLTQEPKQSLASLRLVSILLSIIEGHDSDNKGDINTFDILNSTAPANKFKAIKILSSLLMEIIPQNIENDEMFCKNLTPGTVVQRLFSIYVSLDCLIESGGNRDENDALNAQCYSEFSARFILEIGTLFQNLLSSSLWSVFVVKTLCGEMQRMFNNGDKELGLEQKDNGTYDIWRVLSALTLLNTTSYKIRIGSIVKILSTDKNSKLPTNRQGRIVYLDEQKNCASVVLADGEVVEDMELDQFELSCEASVISDTINSSNLKTIFDNAVQLLQLKSASLTVIGTTYRYRLMQFISSVIDSLCKEGNDLIIDDTCLRELLRVASTSVLIQNEFPSFDDLNQKMEELKMSLRDINLSQVEINKLTSPAMLQVSEKADDGHFQVFSTGSLLEIDDQTTYRVNSDLGDEWECPQCETPNETDVQNCEMCDFERPKLAGIVLGEVWPQSLTMDLFHVPGLGRKSYTVHETSELMKKGYGVNWHGQATLANTISAQPKASFEFKINNLKQHADHNVEAGNFIRCGLMKENIDISEELESNDIFAWNSQGKMFKATNRLANEAKEVQKLHVSYICNVDDTIKQQQSVVCEDPSGPFLCSVKRHFPTWRLNDISLKSGKWYYEIDVVGDVSGSCPQLGWADEDFKCYDGVGKGVGDCKHSWGVDGYRKRVWNAADTAYGKKWENGDRIGLAVDIDKKTMGFYVNNEYQGDAFVNCNFTGGLYPAFTLSGHGRMKIRVFFGGTGKLKYAPPQGYKAVYDYFGIIYSKRKKARENFKLMPIDINKQTSRYMLQTLRDMDDIISKSNSESADNILLGGGSSSASDISPEPLVRTVSELHNLTLAPQKKKKGEEANAEGKASDLSIYTDKNFCSLFEKAVDVETMPIWKENDVVKVERDYKLSRLSLYVNGSLAHTMTQIPATVLQPFIEIAGANTSLTMLQSNVDGVRTKVSNDISVKTSNKTYPYNFQDVLQDKSVYVGICCKASAEVELVRLYIQVDNSNGHVKDFSGHMNFLSLQKAGQINGKLADNSTVELSGYCTSSSNAKQLEKCTFEISMLSSSSLDLIGTSMDGECSLFLRKQNTEVALRLNKSSFINFGYLGFSKTADFTFETWLRTENIERDQGCILRVGDVASNALLFSISTTKFILTGMERNNGSSGKEKLISDILTYDLFESDEMSNDTTPGTVENVWQHIAFSFIRPSKRIQQWEPAGDTFKVFGNPQDAFKAKKILKPILGPIILSNIPDNVPYLHCWDINIVSRKSGIRIGVIFEDDTLPLSKRICYISTRKIDSIHICGVDYPVDDPPQVPCSNGDTITVLYNSEIETLSFFLNFTYLSQCQIHETALRPSQIHPFVALGSDGDSVDTRTATKTKLTVGIWTFFKNSKIICQMPSIFEPGKVQGQFTIGCDENETKFKSFNGQIGECRVWERGLTQSDLSNTSREPVPTRKPMKGLIHWYPMMVGVGNVAYDVKASSHGLICHPDWIADSKDFRISSPERMYWNSILCHSALKIDPIDPSRVRQTSTSAQGRTVLGDIPLSSGKFSWEVRVNKLNRYCNIGVGTKKTSLTSFVGSNSESWGLYNAGDAFHNNEKSHATSTKYQGGDVVTVYVDTVLGTLTWGINGEMVGFKYTNIRGKVLYPAVTLYYDKDDVTIRNMKSESETTRILHDTVKREFELASTFFDSNDFQVSVPGEKSDGKKRVGELVNMFRLLNNGNDGINRNQESKSNVNDTGSNVTSPNSKRHKSLKKAIEFVGDVGDICSCALSNAFDGSFETADHLIPQSSKLCDNAQKVVCAQGPLWRLSLMSQTIHTASALEILYARRATLRLLELSKNNSARLVKALNGDVSNIFKVCQLLVASSSDSEIDLLGTYMQQILKQDSPESKSLSRAVLAESIFVLMRSICTMNSVYKGTLTSEHLDVIDDRSAIENPNPKFGFWLLGLVLDVPEFLRLHSSSILAALLSFISLSEGTLRSEGLEVLVRMVTLVQQNFKVWEKPLIDRVLNHFDGQLDSLFKSKSSRRSKYMANLVRLYLVLSKMDARVLASLPAWLNDILCCFSLCEKISGNNTNNNNYGDVVISDESIDQDTVEGNTTEGATITKGEKQYVVKTVRELGFQNNENLQMFASEKETTKVPTFDKLTFSIMKSLVQCLNHLLKKKSTSSSNTQLKDLVLSVQFDSNVTSRFKALNDVSPEILQWGTCILFAINKSFVTLTDFISFEPDVPKLSLLKQIMEYRQFLLWNLKLLLWQDTLKSTYANADNYQSITIDRLATYSLRGKTATVETLNKSIFGQIFKRLHYIDPKMLRHKSKEMGGPYGTWKVDFVGESSIDQGGPFRDTLTQCVTDLWAEHVMMLVKVPNNRNNSGEFGRDKLVPNPENVSDDHLQMWRFVGKIMGIALRINNPLPFDLPSLVWKILVSEEINRFDLKAIDESFYQINERILKCDANDIEGFKLSHVVINNAGEEKELMKGGDEVPVTGSNYVEYVSMCEQYRINELKQQCLAIKAGISTIVPVGMLHLWTWEELELNVCGKKGFDIDLLKEHTEFKDSYENNLQFQGWLWKSLEALDEEERENFLRFCWGRSRLPVAKDGWTHKFAVHPKSGDDNALPTGHTCFFQIDIPRYTSQEILEKRLRTAVKWGNGAIDDD